MFSKSREFWLTQVLLKKAYDAREKKNMHAPKKWLFKIF